MTESILERAGAPTIDNPSALSESERIRLLYQTGRITYKLQRHQRPDHDKFVRWNIERQSDAYRKNVRDIGAQFDNLWVDEKGRRWGKTAKWLIIAGKECLSRPGSRGMIATPLQKSIGGIIVPLTKILFADAPAGYFPDYKGTNTATGDHECLYFPAVDSSIKLVGLDKHADALRGSFLDFCIITEAGFVQDLEETVRAAIYPQFSRRAWAWIALESSTAKQPDHEFNIVFREDARARGCYSMHTIEDNTELSAEDIETEIARAGGRDHPTCKRELFCICERDPEDSVIPEFDEAKHVVEAGPMPDYAHCYTAADPGTRDPFGMIWGYVDWARDKLVIQRSWAKSNASTAESAEMCKRVEQELWGTAHGVHAANPAVPTMSILDAVRTAGGLVWAPPASATTYWSESNRTFQPNPYLRVSDTAAQVILDMSVLYGLSFSPTPKDDATAAVNALRFAFQQNKIEVWDDSGPLIAQLRSGQWNDLRTDWQRSSVLGHLDCLAALVYLWRNLRRHINPNPPAIIDMHPADMNIPTDYRRPQVYAGKQFRESSVKQWR